MNMIRHDDVAADSNSVLLTGLSKLKESRVNSLVGQKLTPLMTIECYEIQRRIILLKHEVQSRRGVGHGES